jgi:two-component system NtrC family sensor kinase
MALTGAVVIPILSFGMVAWQDRRFVLTQAEQNIKITIKVIEMNVKNIFDTQQLILGLINDHIRGMSWQEIEASHELHQYLVELVARYPEVSSLWLIDPTGIVRASSSPKVPLPPIDVDDRDYFVALQKADVGVFVGSLVRGRITDAEEFNVAVRRTGPTPGAFDGVIDLSPMPSYFVNFWHSIAHNKTMVVDLVRDDGSILVCTCTPDKPKLTLDGKFVRKVRSGAAEAYRNKSMADGQERLVAVENVLNAPLYVGEGVNMDEVLQPWYKDLLLYGAFFAITTIALMAATYTAARAMTREASAHELWKKTAEELSVEAVRREAAERDLRQAHKMEAIGQLVGGIAHDFNNLLSVIVGNLELLRTRINQTELRYVAAAMDAAQRSAKSIRYMLLFARQHPLQIEIFDLKHSLQSMESLLLAALEAKVNLIINYSAVPCLVKTGRNELELAIFNMFLNARDALRTRDSGTITMAVAKVSLCGSPENLVGDYATIAVTDTGEGMSDEVRAKAFDPFFTTKGPNGTGLGLSMVYGFAKQSGGTIAIDSTPRVGTTIKIYLPINKNGSHNR